MKTSFLLSVFAFLAVGNIHSQEKDVEFNRLNTRKLTLKGQTAPDIFNVSQATIEEPKHPEYTKLKVELEKLIDDSISKQAEYDKALDRFKDVSIIKNNVIAFNNSNESFGKKMTLLKEAQILASKHHITDLFYSDNEINKDMKAGFLLLTLNPENLKTHLGKILLRLNSKIKVPETPEYVSSVALRKKINTTKNAHGCMLQNSKVLPEDITGHFVVTNSYYVVSMPTNGFIKNQLVLKNTVLSLGITTKKLYTPKEKMLIQNKQTKEMYLVDTSFIDYFSVKS